MTPNPYDFTDVSDVPEELQKRFVKSKSEPVGVQTVVDIVIGAPAALTLAQIMVVAARLGAELPAENTVRSYLNLAVGSGRLSKPSRQTYASPVTASEETPVETTSTVPAEESDPLAGIV